LSNLTKQKHGNKKMENDIKKMGNIISVGIGCVAPSAHDILAAAHRRNSEQYETTRLAEALPNRAGHSTQGAKALFLIS